ncbi:hypothetical protein K402DRAFT_422645 [Aulographum hederae CBS 113979]|uniref:Inclusion body clearance protein IML2 n=1 Tax=Aulographum hederae CBS 113979 TaxID=1176131 RepID=A0A6G1GVB0_9PEZI|nr:hypothetical protein K402DRAFT_422645 [Aulographum hederae CBS 113979]
MSLRSFLGGGSRSKNASSESVSAKDESAALDNALQSTLLIMNDDIDGAESGLAKGDSSFHKLGSGVVLFLRATLGFEPEVMRDAADKLYDAESSASKNQSRAPKVSSIYSPGSEYGLCLAESQLMGAVLAVLNESLTESVRGFYKLRKAFITLDAILAEEKKYLARIGNGSRPVSATGSGAGTPGTPHTPNTPSHLRSVEDLPAQTAKVSLQPKQNDGGNDSDEDVEFVDADEVKEVAATPSTYQGRLSTDDRPSSRQLDGNTSSAGTPSSDSSPTPDVFSANPVDLFIHSGSNLCFGVLLLIISIIPPAFSTLLKIVGFRGDREKGIAMLWEASKFANVNGAFAGLVVLGYYNTIMGSCDIVPRTGEGAYPKERCKALLHDMRGRFPKSRLWLLEEARMLAGQGELEKAVELLSKQEKSQLKQVEALSWFERSLDAMYMHDYETCSMSFQKCITLNNWSHALYYFISGVCQVELYRTHLFTDPSKAATHKAQAEKFLHEVPKHTGKKRFMARQLPFDVFSTRKIQKWEARAKDWGCDFVDAVGVSPVEEMILFWNGYKRMRPEHLERSLERLAWSESEENANWAREGLDEKAILALLRATTLVRLGRLEEGRKILDEEILSHDPHEFKGHLKDNWTCPVAHYEMGVLEWRMWDGKMDEEGTGRLKKCQHWIEKAANWESYELDARVGLRVTTARETLKKCGVSSA